MIHQPKVILQKRINNVCVCVCVCVCKERERERERERVITFFEKEIENKMRKRSIKIKKYSNKPNIKLSKP